MCALRRRLSRLARGDTGAATTVSLVVLTPILTLLLFAAFQAALWNHARTQARATAHATAALVARAGALPADAKADAETNLAARSDLTRIDVQIDVNGGTVIVTITGQAPGIVVGTSASVRVQSAVPVEGWSHL